eukprot:444455_1
MTTVVILLLFLLTHHINSQCVADISAYGDDDLLFYISHDSGKTWQLSGNAPVWNQLINKVNIPIDNSTIFKFVAKNNGIYKLKGNPGGFIATVDICGPTNECQQLYTDKFSTFIVDENDIKWFKQQGYNEIAYYKWGSTYPWAPSNIFNPDKINGQSPNINDNAYWFQWEQIDKSITITLQLSRFKNIFTKICSNEWNDNENLFVIPNIRGTNFSEAETYCQTHYNGHIANIYDPDENRRIQQLVTLNYLEYAFIGYYKIGSKWKWDSEWNKRINITSNPMLWLKSPLADITSNIEQTETNCIYMTRHGWQYTQCNDNEFFLVCERRDHVPKFVESGPFAISKRTLGFNDARSLCRAQYKVDLATIYEEQEYKKAKVLCVNGTTNSNYNSSNCWIGYQRGITNKNEWEWVQDIPMVTIPTNNLINTNAWTIDPWQNNTAHVYCQITEKLRISYSIDGDYYDYIGNDTELDIYGNDTIYYQARDVLYSSFLEFTVTSSVNTVPGIRCSIYYEDAVYNTGIDNNNQLYWTISGISKGNYKSTKIIEQNSNDLNDEYASTDDIQDDAKWIWNKYFDNNYENMDNTTNTTIITFKFSFEYVKNSQNKPNDNCA